VIEIRPSKEMERMIADKISQLWAVFTGWDDLFEICIYPAITVEEGLELLKQMTPT
jgi:hypothetical protein